MRKLLFLLGSMLLFIGSVLSQDKVIKGKVTDDVGNGLPNVTVSVKGTSIGTTTKSDGSFSLTAPSSAKSLVFSSVGMAAVEVSIGNKETIDVTLKPTEKAMEEVVIRSSNEVKDGWDKYGKFFLENFIGSTPNAQHCTLQNPEVVHFYYYKKSEKLKVLATEPIVISNMALGYNLRYQLDSFMYYYKTQVSSYRGYCFFSEMDSNFAQQRIWSANRKKAYDGSKLQFMRSYYDSTLNEDGYEIALLDSAYDKRFDAIRNPYDTTYYGVYDSTHEVEVYYPRKISITYKKKPEVEYLKKFKLPLNVGSQISYIDLLDAIEIKENGYFYDQKDWVSQGYWSWKNLADLLPYDYIP